MRYELSGSYLRQWQRHHLQGALLMHDDGGLTGLLRDGRHVAGCLVRSEENLALALLELPINERGRTTVYLLRKTGQVEGSYLGVCVSDMVLGPDRCLSYDDFVSVFSEVPGWVRKTHRAKLKLRPVAD